MKCLKCRDNLYINLKEKKLICLNCNFTSLPEKIIWYCNVCGIDFRSNAIVYNPLQNEYIKRIIKQTLFIKHKAHPNKLPCCKLNIFFTDFYHKKDCKGILYIGELNHKIIIVCEKCKIQVKNKNLIAHKKKECEMRIIKCKECSQEFPYKNKKYHTMEKCKNNQINYWKQLYLKEKERNNKKKINII